MKRTSKIGATNGINTNNLIGAVVGGVGNAVIDEYVKPVLPKISGIDTASLVKIGAGIFLPMVLKGNKLAENGSNALLACGISDIVKNMVFTKEEPKASTSGVWGLDDDDITFVGSQQRIPFPEYKATLEDNTIGSKKATLVG